MARLFVRISFGMASDPKAWNPWHGCKRYSEGCKFCYMYYLDAARGVPEKSFEIKKTNDFLKPLAKYRDGQYKYPSGSYFRINMTSDTFLEEADEWREEMWRIIKARPDIHFYILTKRVPRIKECLPEDWGEGYENAEFQITVENQRAFDERWPIFKDIPAKHKGFNVSPLVGPVDIRPALETGQIELVYLAGEGYGSDRECRYEWVKKVSDDCMEFGVNFIFNSTGTNFVKDSKRYFIKSPGLQAVQAYRSKLSHYYGRPKYDLYSPYDGHLLQESELVPRRFNLNRCLTCTSFEDCVGCQNCGNCKKVELVEYDDIVRIRKEKGL